MDHYHPRCATAAVSDSTTIVTSPHHCCIHYSGFQLCHYRCATSVVLLAHHHITAVSTTAVSNFTTIVPCHHITAVSTAADSNFATIVPCHHITAVSTTADSDYHYRCATIVGDHMTTSLLYPLQRIPTSCRYATLLLGPPHHHYATHATLLPSGGLIFMKK